jgi:S1-C subfamily serine protease
MAMRHQASRPSLAGFARVAALLICFWAAFPLAAQQSPSALLDLETRAHQIFLRNHKAVVAIQIRPATSEAPVTLPLPVDATPVIGGDESDGRLIELLRKELEESIILQSYSGSIPEAASGESFFSYYGRVKSRALSVWENSVRRGVGMALDATGHVLTTARLLEHRNDGDRIWIASPKGWVPAQVVGVDSFTNLAVLRSGTRVSSWLNFAVKPKLREGQFIFGLTQSGDNAPSAQWGTLAGVGRHLPGLENVGYAPLLETTLQLFPGSSGSPCFNLDGSVVGMVMETRRRNSVIYSYAMPSSVILPVVRKLIADGKREPGFLGVTLRVPGKKEDTERRVYLSIPKDLEGVLIRELWDGEAAMACGLRVDDLVLRAGDILIKDWRDLVWAVNLTPPSSKIDVEVWREGKREVFPVLIGRPPREK